MAGRVDIAGLDKALRNLNALAAGLTQVGGVSVRAAGARLGEAMERNAPELSDELEGSIARSIHTERKSETEILVGTRHGLARVFEDGGEITPRVKSRLKFEGRSGDTVYATRVTVPAQSFVRRAVDEESGAAGQAAELAATRAVRRLTG
jgi:hypothetical protein